VHALLYEGRTPTAVVGDLMALPVGSELAMLRFRR
jgi:hypothetical protein